MFTYSYTCFKYQHLIKKNSSIVHFFFFPFSVHTCQFVFYKPLIHILIMSALWTGLESSKKKKGFRDFSSMVSVQEAGWWPNDMAGWHWEKVSQHARPQRWAEAKGNVVLGWQW